MLFFVGTFFDHKDPLISIRLRLELQQALERVPITVEYGNPELEALKQQVMASRPAASRFWTDGTGHFYSVNANNLLKLMLTNYPFKIREHFCGHQVEQTAFWSFFSHWPPWQVVHLSTAHHAVPFAPSAKLSWQRF